MTALLIDPSSPEHSILARTRLDSLFAGLTKDATQFDFYYALRHVDAYTPGTMPLGRAARPRDSR